MEKELLKDDAGIMENDFSSYFLFHLANKGYEFITDKNKIRSKLEVYIEHRHFPNVLRTITLGRHKGLTRIDKPGWKDGILLFKQNRRY